MSIVNIECWIGDLRTFVCHGKVQGQIFFDVARVVLELEQTGIQLRIERSQIVEVALLAEPLRPDVREVSSDPRTSSQG